jgi:hypothetical protein
MFPRPFFIPSQRKKKKMKMIDIGTGTEVKDVNGKPYIVRGVQSFSLESNLVSLGDGQEGMEWQHRVLVTFLIQRKQRPVMLRLGVAIPSAVLDTITLEYPAEGVTFKFGGMIAEPQIERFVVESPPHNMERIRLMLHPAGMPFYGWVGRVGLERAYKMAVERQGVLYD